MVRAHAYAGQGAVIADADQQTDGTAVTVRRDRRHDHANRLSLPAGAVDGDRFGGAQQLLILDLQGVLEQAVVIVALRDEDVELRISVSRSLAAILSRVRP